MYFKEELLVRLFVGENQQFRFEYSNPRKILLDFAAEKLKERGALAEAICTALVEWNPSDSVREGFESLEAGKLPAGSKLPESHADIADSDGRLKPGHAAVPPSALPEALRSVTQQVGKEISDLTAATVKAIRWRLDYRGSHNPIRATRGLYFSTDGNKWTPLIEFGGRMEVIGSVYFPKGVYREIEQILANGMTEPLGHELHREAWEQRYMNPRSSLIIGLAAGEVGCKECISILAPDARWLAENSPSPPLARMLQEYLPLLRGKCTFQGNILPPPDDILKSLRKGIEMRNRTTHVGTQSIFPTTLEEVLLAVKDVLWLLDYYSGSAWALDYIRTEVRAKLPAN
jgi:hypothetical protein